MKTSCPAKLHHWYVVLTDVLAKDLIHQMFWELTAAFFSGVCGLRQWLATSVRTTSNVVM